MFIPSKTKYRKAFKGRIKGLAGNGYLLSNGDYGLKALGAARINSKQIESARRVIVKSLSKTGKIWIRIFPNIPVSKKPVDVRMGKGKGAIESWVFRVKPGKILFEVDGNVAADVARQALMKASAKLPIRCKFVMLED